MLSGGKLRAGTYLLALVAGAAGAVGSASAAAPTGYKLGVDSPGVYRASYEQLAEVAPVPASAKGFVDVASIVLSNRGLPVPIWIEGGADGRFGPGDSIQFAGDRLAGESTYYAANSRWNVYRLSFAGPAGSTGSNGSNAARLKAPPSAPESVLSAVHHERQELRVRFSPQSGESVPEVWYWAKLTAVDPEPFRLAVELGDRETGGPVTLRVGLRGWSRPTGSRGPDRPADHRVEARWNGAPAGSIEWREQEAGVLDVVLPPGTIRAANDLELRVPRRAVEAAGAPASGGTSANAPEGARAPSPETQIDVVLLDWIELTGLGASRSPVPARPAGWISTDLPSDLRNPAQQADYLMIVHPRLAEAIEPLARFHRARGLDVEVVPVDEIYDEFADGVEDPEAIREFVAHSRREWQRPAPRFVLLVGDASWDPYHGVGDDRRYADWTYRPGELLNFGKNSSTPYADAQAGRNLIPAYSVPTSEGEAASDNAFVAVEGDDDLPDLAIGRFAVSRPEEVEAIVAKTIRYASRDDSGDWQRRVLWITDELQGFKSASDKLASGTEEQGLVAGKIYPGSDEADNLAHKAEIRRRLDEGQLLVHFLGHGGRYIWRTGPPDLKKNHDLFTLEDLDALASGRPLPVILSMTCYSAPFDHPTADSIGEKFLRVADRGAVAIFAASWRNAPAHRWSESVIEELLRPGMTIGEAITASKRSVGDTAS